MIDRLHDFAVELSEKNLFFNVTISISGELFCIIVSILMEPEYLLELILRSPVITAKLTFGFLEAFCLIISNSVQKAEK
jgi:hypothetical protein